MNEPSSYELKNKTKHLLPCNSPIHSSSNNRINTINIQTYPDSISLFPWLPWLVSHLWRLGRLGSEGWTVVGLRVLGGCDRQCDPMMFRECLLPSAAAAAAAAAKSLQSCLTLCDPIDGSLPGSSVPGILQARTLCRSPQSLVTGEVN